MTMSIRTISPCLRPLRFLPSALLIGGLLVCASPAHAAPVVDVATDGASDDECVVDCTLREAIFVALPGETILFAPGLAGATINLTAGQLLITKNLTIDSGALDVTLSAGSTRMVKVQGAATTVTISGLVFRDGGPTLAGDKNGGALDNEGVLTVSGAVFRDNRTYGVPNNTVSASGGDGGAIYNAAGAYLVLDGVVLRDSSTGNGGLSVGEEYHGGHGGAIYNAGRLELIDSTVRGSVTGLGHCAMSHGGDGGAIYNAGTGDLTVTGTTIETSVTGNGGSQGGSCPPFGDPGTDGRGGAIYNLGDLALNNVTLTGNATANGAAGVAQPGGGVYNAGGNARLRNVTITANTSRTNSGGGVFRSAGTLRIKNSLIAGNTASAGNNEDCGGTIVSELYNLVGIADGCTGFGVNDQTGTFGGPLDPLLNPIGANGGPTDTYLPQSGSLAIDLGNPDANECDAFDAATGVETPFTVDQRGLPRPTDGDGAAGARCDVGAVEVPASAMADVAISKTNGVTNVIAGQPLTYTIVASNLGPDPVTGATVADLFPAELTCSWTCVASVGATCEAGPVADDVEDTIDLAVGATATYTLACDLAPGATGSVSNTATIAVAGVPDPVPGNNSATDLDTIVTGIADLALTLSDGQVAVAPGGQAPYEVMVSNAGPSPVVDAILTVDFAGATTCTWTCSGTGGGVCAAGPLPGDVNELIDLPVGATVHLVASCTVAVDVTGSITANAAVSPPMGVADPELANNTASDVDTLLIDFGDASGPGYPTLIAANGARHALSGSLWLGAAVDSEADGQPTALADGDGADDDGVVWLGGLYRGLPTNVEVTATASGLLDVFIDWNADGDWADPGEQVAVSAGMIAGPNVVSITPPADATIAFTVARFRLSSAGGLGAAGPAADGEVEDHRVYVGPFGDGFESGDLSRWSASTP